MVDTVRELSNLGGLAMALSKTTRTMLRFVLETFETSRLG